MMGENLPAGLKPALKGRVNTESFGIDEIFEWAHFVVWVSYDIIDEI